MGGSAFAALVRTKLPLLDDRRLMKTFHRCGEENELGEFALLPVRGTQAFCQLTDIMCLLYNLIYLTDLLRGLVTGGLFARDVRLGGARSAVPAFA